MSARAQRLERRDRLQRALEPIADRAYTGVPALRQPGLLPCDGLCVYHGINAGVDPTAFFSRAQTIGDFPFDGGFFCHVSDERQAHASAKLVQCKLMSALYGRGEIPAADRLTLAGAAGYPGADEFNVLADVLAVRFEVLDLSRFLAGEVDEASVEIFGGDGALPISFRLGHCYVRIKGE